MPFDTVEFSPGLFQLRPDVRELELVLRQFSPYQVRNSTDVAGVVEMFLSKLASLPLYAHVYLMTLNSLLIGRGVLHGIVDVSAGEKLILKKLVDILPIVTYKRHNWVAKIQIFLSHVLMPYFKEQCVHPDEFWCVMVRFIREFMHDNAESLHAEEAKPVPAYSSDSFDVTKANRMLSHLLDCDNLVVMQGAIRLFYHKLICVYMGDPPYHYTGESMLLLTEEQASYVKEYHAKYLDTDDHVDNESAVYLLQLIRSILMSYVAVHAALSLEETESISHKSEPFFNTLKYCFDLLGRYLERIAALIDYTDIESYGLRPRQSHEGDVHTLHLRRSL